MSDNTARNKVPLPHQVMASKPKPPPLQRRARVNNALFEEVSVQQDDELTALDGLATDLEQVLGFSDLPDDDEKTAAFQVPEELLRRSRVGDAAVKVRPERSSGAAAKAGFELDDRVPDSRKNTSPPPPMPDEISSAPIGGGVEHVLGSGAAAPPASTEIVDDDDESGEFTRIEREGDIDKLKAAPSLGSLEPAATDATRTKISRRDARQKGPSNGLLWGVIGMLVVTTSVLAALLLKGM